MKTTKKRQRSTTWLRKNPQLYFYYTSPSSKDKTSLSCGNAASWWVSVSVSIWKIFFLFFKLYIFYMWYLFENFKKYLIVFFIVGKLRKKLWEIQCVLLSISLSLSLYSIDSVRGFFSVYSIFVLLFISKVGFLSLCIFLTVMWFSLVSSLYISLCLSHFLYFLHIFAYIVALLQHLREQCYQSRTGENLSVSLSLSRTHTEIQLLQLELLFLFVYYFNWKEGKNYHFCLGILNKIFIKYGRLILVTTCCQGRVKKLNNKL